jgi:hypothetical protein
MAEWMRRLRMGLAHPSPGASGDTARPNYVGPSGNGLVGADERGRNPAESRAYRMGAPVRFQKAVSGSKENAAVERRQANAQRHWAYAARRHDVTPRLSALRSLTSREGRCLPHRVVRENHDGAPRASATRGGGALTLACRLFDT